MAATPFCPNTIGPLIALQMALYVRFGRVFLDRGAKKMFLFSSFQ